MDILLRAWTEDNLLSLIRDAVEERLDLEYKRCGALQRDDKKIQELSKDVSALANSTGGTIVYGMVEDGHLPKTIDEGFDPADISKEWLAQVILGNISPPLQGVTIHPVHLRSHSRGRYAYVVSVPQSTTAHQAKDKRYYRRYNTINVPMGDHEIRDIMNRQKHPALVPRFNVTRMTDRYKLTVSLVNKGQVRAQHVKLVFSLPKTCTTRSIGFLGKVVHREDGSFGNDWNEYVFKGNSQVVFPDDEFPLEDVGHFLFVSLDSSTSKGSKWESVVLHWKVYADDMPATTGHLLLKDLFNPEEFGGQR
ncbi:MAG: ATP-binding protein [Nitrospira sp. BO4]|jgi:hypothetical protein|nr:ATP-binding protein [Nitrospira sp. BO4]